MSDNDRTSNFVFNKHSEKNPNGQQVQHRCNGYLEDVLEGVSQWPMDIAKPFSLFLSCLRSQPGQEPPRYKSQKD
ncbi:hypothetical protein EDC94DRAFT_570318 [Helicostylum pulchrum]|nr:hypothetical protein EDC94DRAFT_570318 [Helicostylum pulchrum]